MRALVNARARRAGVPAARHDAAAFHAGLDGYAPTPVRPLPGTAAELGLGAVLVKDESDRLGLPAFKVLGASWAVERALREQPATTMLVAASAGNHGRAVAHVAARRGLRCRIFLPDRSLPVRREAIAAEGAEVVVVEGTYEDAVARAEADASTDAGAMLVADVGGAGPAEWVIDGYATLFTEAAAQADVDVLVVPVGVGSLAAAASRHAAAEGLKVIGVEPVTAACLAASLAAGRPTAVPTPGTTMAGLDCAEVSPAAWPSLLAGIHGTVAVDDAEVAGAAQRLAAAGMRIGESGAAALAGLVALMTDPAAADLRAACCDETTRVLVVATESHTGAGIG